MDRREYYRKYREDHREELRAYQKQWRSENKDKVNTYMTKYWMKKAKEIENENQTALLSDNN